MQEACQFKKSFVFQCVGDSTANSGGKFFGQVAVLPNLFRTQMSGTGQ
jgi:hypothetical protein